MSKYVILRPLGRNIWPGVRRYRNCYDGIGPYLTRSGARYIGLSKTDQERLGQLTGKDLGPSSSFWDTFMINMGDKDWYLDIEEPLDEIRYLFLKNHRRVASSIFERKPSADYVLVNKEEEAKQANVFNKAKRRASREFDRMSAEDIRRCLRLYGHNATNMGNEQAENLLFELVEGNPQKYLDRWVDNKQREDEFLLETAISRNVIRKNKNTYLYGADIIGHSQADAIFYLSNPKNQDIKLSILSEVGIKEQFLGVEEPKEKPEKKKAKADKSSKEDTDTE